MIATEGDPVFLWASIGTQDNPPDRLQVESCHDCSALVPVERFDRHGQWHAQLRRLLGT
jgi:hypothetical protein